MGSGEAKSVHVSLTRNMRVSEKATDGKDLGSKFVEPLPEAYPHASKVFPLRMIKQ
jgi:hypothetical protein